jgi:RHS repeat-associated protein
MNRPIPAYSLLGFDYNGAKYIYVKNLQGDIVGIVDNTGALVVEYAYDAWGGLISATGALAEVNPFRYRGYYYDVETGLYYCQSRYYDPAVKRWIDNDYFGSNFCDNRYSHFGCANMAVPCFARRKITKNFPKLCFLSCLGNAWNSASFLAFRHLCHIKSPER